MIFLFTIDSHAKHGHLALLGFTLRVGRVIVVKLKNFSTSFPHRTRLFPILWPVDQRDITFPFFLVKKFTTRFIITKQTKGKLVYFAQQLQRPV